MLRIVSAVLMFASLLAADITVAAAASYKNALDELIGAYKDGKVEAVYAASGKLTQQIQAGAPFDVFMSADMKYPNEVANLGLARGDVVKTVENKLILWSRSVDVKSGISLLTNKKIRQIAVANPKTAPLGEAAIAALKNSKIYDRVESKLVYGDNIAQATTFVESGAADVGITGYSVVADKIAAGQGSYVYLDSKTYDPLIYGSVILKDSKNAEEAQKFMDFLRSDDAKKIFEKHGLSVVK